MKKAEASSRQKTIDLAMGYEVKALFTGPREETPEEKAYYESATYTEECSKVNTSICLLDN